MMYNKASSNEFDTPLFLLPDNGPFIHIRIVHYLRELFTLSPHPHNLHKTEPKTYYEILTENILLWVTKFMEQETIVLK